MLCYITSHREHAIHIDSVTGVFHGSIDDDETGLIADTLISMKDGIDRYIDKQQRQSRASLDPVNVMIFQIERNQFLMFPAIITGIVAEHSEYQPRVKALRNGEEVYLRMAYGTTFKALHPNDRRCEQLRELLDNYQTAQEVVAGMRADILKVEETLPAFQVPATPTKEAALTTEPALLEALRAIQPQL